jgi:hypothetical protein
VGGGGKHPHSYPVPTNPARAIPRFPGPPGGRPANAILTVYTEALGHLRLAENGRDAARVAVEMTNLLKRL